MQEQIEETQLEGDQEAVGAEGTKKVDWLLQEPEHMF